MEDTPEFLQFLAAQGLTGQATLVTGRKPAAVIAELLQRGELTEGQLADARRRFGAHQGAPANGAPASEAPTIQRPEDATGSRPAEQDAADERHPLLGQVIGGCRIDKLLGVGGMGEVYLATQLSLDRRVALKVQKNLGIPELLDRFRTEARTLGKMRSPHIVEIYEVGSERNVPYFVMEFMPGGSMTSYVRKQPDKVLARPEAIDFLSQCCRGLAEAKRHGVLHRDIKPDNLLLGDNGLVKIADFGIAKALDGDLGLTQTGFSPGTPAFKSPEQMTGRELDFRTDMYSLGMSFWNLVTGEIPKDVVSRQEAIAKLDARQLSFLAPELTRAGNDPFRILLCKMMALDRDQRFASWEQLIEALRELPDQAPASDRKPPRRGAATQRPLLIAGLTAGLAGLAIVGYQFRSRPEPPVEEGKGEAKAPEEAKQPAVTPAPNPEGTGKEAEQAGDTKQRNDDKGATPDGAPVVPDQTEKNEKTDPPKDSGPAPTPVHPPSEPPKVDPKIEARQIFLKGLESQSGGSPRTAAEVGRARAILQSTATDLDMLENPVYQHTLAQIELEHAAATARDALLAVTALTRFEEEIELKAKANVITLENYRKDCTEHVERLFQTRPEHLRIAAADWQKLAKWADWEASPGNITKVGDRLLPTLVKQKRRDATMLLIHTNQVPPFYLDCMEVSVDQWSQTRTIPASVGSPRTGDQPIRGVPRADIEYYLNAWGLRLPTVAEFGAALGQRTGDVYWWGNSPTPPADWGRINVADAELHRQSPSAVYLPGGYDDGVAGMAPVHDARFGQGIDKRLLHLLGNVAEHVRDAADIKVLGGSFQTSSWDQFKCSYRQSQLGDRPRQDVGFRGARSVD